MKVVYIVIGCLLLLAGLTSIPRLLARVGRDDGAYLAGRATVVAVELAAGAGFLYYGIRSRQPTGAASRRRNDNSPPD